MKNIIHLFQPLEDTIRTKFIPVFCGRPAPNDELRNLLALPCRLGGINFVNPASTADQEYSTSKEVPSPVVNSILSQDGLYSYEVFADQLTSVAEIKKRKHLHLSSTASQLKASLPPDFQRAMDLSQEKGGSNWLTVLPVEEFGFSLHKDAFRNALALRYSWHLHTTPSKCSCVSNFTVEYILSCPKGGYPSIRHNEI